MTTWEADAMADEMALWREKYNWRRSRKGNMYRRLPGRKVVTIFAVGEGWGYCVSVNSTPIFSKHCWPTEEDAMDAAMAATESKETS